MTFSLDYSVRDSAKGSNINFDLDFDIGGKATLKDLSQQIKLAQILIAKTVLREEQADGFDKKPIVRVDGVQGRAIQQVKPFGRIEYFSRLSDLEVLLQVYRAIQERSPVRSGQYRNSNYVFANNRLVAQNEQQFFKFVEDSKKTGIGEIREIRFVNVTPYAARLEYSGTRTNVGGLNKGSTTSRRRTGKSRSKKTFGRSIKKPNGAYYLASRTLSSVKGFFSQVKFEFIPNGFAGITIQSDGFFRTSYANTKKNQAKRRVGKPYVYPSIVFKISKLGVVTQ